MPRVSRVLWFSCTIRPFEVSPLRPRTWHPRAVRGLIDRLIGRSNPNSETPMPEPACRAPFIALDFDSRGNVQACCANALYPLGNITEQRLPEIWSGERIHHLRAAMLRHDYSLGCTVCRHRRNGDSGALPANYYTSAFPDAGLDAVTPHLLSFSLHNTCNLACIMCGADSSSRIRTRVRGLPPLPHVYDDRFFEDLRPFLAACGAIDFVGGEPFLVKEHQRIWDLLIADRLHPRCSVTTNGTVWNATVERVLDAIDHNVCLSFDGVTAATFESVRVGASFDTVMRNLHRFRDYTRSRGSHMNLSFSLVRQNWFEMGSVLLLAEGLDMPVTIQTVIEPDFGAQRADDEVLRTMVDALEVEDRRIRSQLKINGAAWDVELEKLRTELRHRMSGRRIERIMEPPSHTSPDRVAAEIEAWLETAPAVPADDVDPACQTIRQDLTRWTALPAHLLHVDRALAVVDLDLAQGFLAPPVRIDVAIGSQIPDLLRWVETELDAAMWVVETDENGPLCTTTLWFGDQHRDKEGLLVRLVTVRTGAGAAMVVAADDTMWPTSRRGVSVSLGRRG